MGMSISKAQFRKVELSHQNFFLIVNTKENNT